MKPIDKYVPEKWVGDTDTIGYIMFIALYGAPDMYHHDKYGEHVSTWGVIL